ncbi:MAG: hypothetical protein COW19_09115 [Zetaproteobacteria bacterium CG12_big_fil_rev_8_21_14_0_65_55_1124]|nr:MAG: hypothetical protein AUJ58_01645 [Zetaproteobacteria bacterium CG1_02_55_237]PIS18764.1 MAG: hypothetical protein COT53_09150 [Zetaproteobacteria bacterium CG08_land_8_20_14_0_20_55_17]PIW42256.1 MAG: hypothetical protein COW19_09115 [Zetaproteobacteria bacterium CG12_big_fil_rev_8_21_14_0_65_55_1124]PIY54022.1 MAG: hypothetical protein COZ01_01770 [Zetaproteobacteria bacterium CG_4_10_14_0_8_um_filter_55_43]PIZ37183.1 MAG: hypothetical protein COY36_09935 [Zetaproteobacteria bacterium 
MSKAFRFIDIEQASYVLIGFIPYLLAIYLVIHLDAEITPSLLLAGLVALAAHLTGYSLIRHFGKQLADVREITGNTSISEYKFPIEIDGKSPDELLGIIDNFNKIMQDSKRSSRQLKEMTTKLILHARDIECYQAKLRDEGISFVRLSRYVDKSVAEKIMNSAEDILLQNTKQEATILFADIRAFTTLTEHMTPEDILGFLNTYFDTMVKIIFNHQGVLDKFIGDELMASFGVLGEAKDGPMNAVNAAIAMQARAQSLISEFRAKKYPEFEIGIGINTGNVVMGSVGSENRMDYTVIGDTVNVASRLQHIAEGQCIVVGENTYQRCKAHIPMLPMGEIKLRNRVSSVKYYQVKK